MKVINMSGIEKTFYPNTKNELKILKGIDLSIYAGEFVSIVGQSGSGKSTLMNILGALDAPTSGAYELDGFHLDKLSDDSLSEIRNKKIGFVFQNFNLLSKSTALSNVALPMLYFGLSKKERINKAKRLLEVVNMEDRLTHNPSELSGGQKQRVAIARAMANDPAIILADEPTGALDSSTGRHIMDLFHKLHEEEKKTIIFITHNMELAEETDRIFTIKDGLITDEKVKRQRGERNAV